MRRLVLALAFALLALACEPKVPEGRFECDTDEDCPDDMVCRVERNRCFVTLGDAGE